MGLATRPKSAPRYCRSRIDRSILRKAKLRRGSGPVPQPQRLGDHDRQGHSRIALPGQDVQDDVGRMDALL
jgi:hypothetical protein